MPSLKEQIAALTTAKHKLAVWEVLYAHLDSSYVPKDSGVVQKAVRVPDCMVELVPPEIIEEILQTLSEGPIKELQDEINLIENQELVLKRKAGA
jgi:hypothetical protein